jgi:hypothetical protein
MASSSGPITVTATTGGASPQTSTAQITLTVTGAPSFSLAATPASYQVAQGQSVTATVTLAAFNGFNTALTYTCTDPVSGSTCTGPSGATTATSVTFNITATAPTTAANRPNGRGTKVFYAALLPGLFGIFLIAGSGRRSRGMRLLGLIIVLGFSTLSLTSCGGGSGSGGGSSNPGTPAGNYTITVNATTGGSSPTTGSTTFTLVVVQ